MRETKTKREGKTERQRERVRDGDERGSQRKTGEEIRGDRQ